MLFGLLGWTLKAVAEGGLLTATGSAVAQGAGKDPEEYDIADSLPEPVGNDVPTFISGFGPGQRSALRGQ